MCVCVCVRGRTVLSKNQRTDEQVGWAAIHPSFKSYLPQRRVRGEIRVERIQRQSYWGEDKRQPTKMSGNAGGGDSKLFARVSHQFSSFCFLHLCLMQPSPQDSILLLHSWPSYLASLTHVVTASRLCFVAASSGPVLLLLFQFVPFLIMPLPICCAIALASAQWPSIQHTYI